MITLVSLESATMQAYPEPPPIYAASYFGDTVTHPGLVLGLERPLGPWAFLAGQAGGYLHPQNHSAVLATAEVGARAGLPAGFSVDLAVGAGVLYTWLAAPAYTTGAVPLYDPGHPAIGPTAALGLGYELPGGRRAFARLVGFGEYPYNTYMLPHAALQVGMQWGRP
jgi:hypothetical protein